jgi:hypothetical protein
MGAREMVYQVTTACNGPRVDPGCLAPLDQYLQQSLFVGGVHDALTVGIRDRDSEPYLTMHGCGAEFKPIPASTVREVDGLPDTAPAQDYVDHESFLKTISGWLEERCVVQTVGHDKARFPVTAVQHAVSANGEYQQDTLSWDDL